MTPFSLLLAQTQTAPSASQGIIGMLPLFLLMAAMYFLLIAPQRKKQKQHDAMVKALQSGDEVITSGGIFGTIVAVKDDRFVIRVADDTKFELGKSFVSALVKKTDRA
jgi:preprotein translocase subunit YajC